MLRILSRIYHNPLKHGCLNKIKIVQFLPLEGRAVCIVNISQLTLFKEIITVRSQDCTRHTNGGTKWANGGVTNVRADCTCTNRLDLKNRSRGKF
jgi:hypothetical protein